MPIVAMLVLSTLFLAVNGKIDVQGEVMPPPMSG
jgi:hypothetical protein